jgi:hypothetical protein
MVWTYCKKIPQILMISMCVVIVILGICMLPYLRDPLYVVMCHSYNT